MASVILMGRPKINKKLLWNGETAPHITDLPVMKKVIFNREPTKHLIYHIWPHNRSRNWQWNIKQLLRRIDLFDGIRSISVVTDNETATLPQVKEKFANVRVDNWFEAPNQPLIGLPGHCMSDDGVCANLGEGISFLPLLQTLPRDDHSVTFYGHAKGSRYVDRHICLRWADMLYKVNLDNWLKVYEMLSKFPMVGSFKRYEDFDLKRNWHWHYSGTFFWFRNKDVFQSPSWPRLHPAMYGQVEAWPANLFKAAEVGCLFGDGCQNLYTEPEVQKWERLLEDQKW